MNKLYNRMASICLVSLIGMTLAVSAQPTNGDRDASSSSQSVPATVIVTEVLKTPDRTIPAPPVILSEDSTDSRPPSKSERPKGQSRSQESKPGADKPLLEIRGF